MEKILKFIVIVAVFAISGCGFHDSAKKPGLYVAERSVSMAELTPDDVLFRVNGVDIEKARFERRMRIVEKIYRHKKGLSKEDNPKSLKRHLEASAPGVLQHLLAEELLHQGAAARGIVPTKADCIRAYVEFGKTMGRGDWNESSILRKFGKDDGCYLVSMITNSAVSMAFRRAWSTNDLEVVSEETIDDFLNRLEVFNKDSEHRNAKSRSRAMEVREKILAGEISFVEAARKWANVSPEHGEAWGEFRLSEFGEEEEIHKWLSTAKVGDISYPVDLDDGLALVGVVAITPADLPPGFPPENDYTLVKCTFYAYQTAEKLTREEARKYLLDQRRLQVSDELGKQLYAEAVIEMPNGNDFFVSRKKTTGKNNE